MKQCIKQCIKKTISAVLALSLAAASFAGLTVTAAELYPDYEPVDKPANLLTLSSTESAARNIYTVSARNNSYITVGNVIEEGNKNWITSDQGNHFDTKSITVGSSDVAAEGASVFGGMVIRSQDSKFSVSSFDSNKNYVISFKAKNAGTTSGVKIGASMSNDSLASESFTDSYGSTGMLLTSEYQEFKGTIQPNSSYSTDAAKHNVVIGVPAGTPANSVVYIDITDNDAVYLAEETAYDITNTRIDTAEEITGGTTVQFKAEVLNQLGQTGYLEQDFDWYVMNADKTELLSGFTVVKNPDNSASVTIPRDAEAGEYAVVAVSADYNMAKTIMLNVEAMPEFTDHIPGEKAKNLLTLASTTNSSGIQSAASNIYSSSARNNSYIQVGNVVEEGNVNWVVSDQGGHFDTKSITVGTSAVVAEGASVFGGMVIRSQDSRFSVSSFDADKNYVISFKAKNVGTTENVRIGASMSNDSLVSESYTSAYGKEGMLLTSEYQEFKGAITPNSSYSTDAAKHNVVIGVPAGTAANSVVHIDITDNDAVYFAEEQAYDILVTADKNTILIDDNTITLTAEMINQLGVQGNLSQKFDWYALTSDKSAEVAGITITEGASGQTAVFSWDESLAKGEYVLAAVSEAYGCTRTMRIIVTDDYLDDKSVTSTAENLLAVGTNSAAYNIYNCSGRNSTNITISRLENNWVNDGISNHFDTKTLTVGSSDVTSPGGSAYSGLVLKAANNNFSVSSFDPVKSYVFSMQAKNAGATEDVRIGIGLSNDSLASEAYTKEYGSEGMLLTPEYQTFRGTIKMSEKYSASASNHIMVVGVPAGTPANSVVHLDMTEADDFYLAEEQATKIVLTNDLVDTFSAGDVIDVKAEVVNQLGLTGYLSQDLKWYCVSEDSSRVINGVTITPYEGGAAVTIDRTDDIGDGIRIVAVSESYNLVTGTNPLVDSRTEKRVVYVAPDGNDSANGTEARPLATLEGARNKIRTWKESGFSGAVDVIFAEGEYYFDSPAEFEAADSGSAGNTITYKAADGAEVVFTGAVKLDLSKAKNVSDKTILSRLQNSVKDKVVEIDLSEKYPYDLADDNGIKATTQILQGSYEYPELYLDGNEQILAQWPNGDAQYSTFTYVDADTIGYSGENPSNWTDASGWWIGGYLSYDWLYMRVPALSVDTDNKQITFTTDEANSVLAEDPETETSFRWKAFNLLEELDTPMEWYIDRDNNKLYYYPPYAGTTLEISALKSAMVKLDNTEYVGFENIRFENTRGDAITATDVRNITVTGCTFENIGVNAFAVYGTTLATSDQNYWQRQYIDAAYDCEVSDCKFNNIGGKAILMDGGNVDTLSAGNNAVRNNIFFKISQKIKNYDAIEIKGCGNIVEYNNISRTADQAIHHYGNNHKIQYNEIHDIVQETDDAGAIYGGRNTIQRGTEISFNYIHDLYGTYTPTFGHKPAIYWDDYQTGMKAEHNIIRNALINVYTNGVDNTYNYNTSINITSPYSGINAVNIDFKNGGAASNTNSGQQSTFGSNIADKTLYFNNYTNLSAIVNSSNLEDRSLALYNTIKGNLSIDSVSGNGIGNYTRYKEDPFTYGGWEITAGTENPNVTGNTENGSVTFVNEAAQDYRTTGTGTLETSVLNSSNFDIDKIGIQTDNAIEASEIELAFPYNKAKVGNADIHFMWNDSFGATKYTVTVATDADFSNVVGTATSYYDFADISIKEPAYDGTVYYWKVTAENTSREFMSEKWSSPVYTFTFEKISASAVVVDDNTIQAAVTNNYYESGKDAYVIIAEYEENGSFSAMQALTKTALEYQTECAYTDITLSNPEKAAKVIMFIWDGTNPWYQECTPLREAVTIK